MLKNRIIPFSWLPASWGLRGVTREIAEVEYYYVGKERDWKLLTLKYEGTELELKRLEFKKKYQEITDIEYEKQRATLKGDPWVKILTTEYDPSEPLTGSFELDWNEHFIKSLDDAGYVGVTDEEIVDQWLSELCRNVATEQYGGVGDFDEQAEEAMNSRKNFNAKKEQ